MRLTVLLRVALLALCLHLALPASSEAALPPIPRDPCSQNGRDSCGTLGVGFYKTLPNGTRWYGDFRGAVPGVAHTFCIDAHFWYASPSYDYKDLTAVGLQNRDGKPVSLANQERLAYAVWTFGRTSNPDRQAAVMLYVHTLMGDVTPGEIDPAAVGPAVATQYQRIVRDAGRFHGPYRVSATFPSRPVVARRTTASVRLLSASGAALPNTRLELAADGATGLPRQVVTDANGVAHVPLTPRSAKGVQLRVEAPGMASTRPRFVAPTTSPAAANAQRLAAPSSQHVSRTIPVRVDVAPRVSTQVSAQQTAPGATVTDTVVVSGLGGATVQVEAQLFGPFGSRAAISCTGTPYWQGTFVAAGDGTYTTAPVRLDRAGYYTYREEIAAAGSASGAGTGAGSGAGSGSGAGAGYTTPCGETAETTVVHVSPTVTTVASNEVVSPGARLTDRIRVEGLGKTPATVQIELFGPYPTRAAMTCEGKPYWTGQITVPGNGDYRSPPVAVGGAGLYTFRERILGSEVVTGVTTACGIAEETFAAAPEILAGRGSAARTVTAAAAGARTPVRVRIASLDLDAPVKPAGIDLKKGALGIPTAIDRTGWWRDGAAPTDTAGAVLIAGHVDDADAGIGAFFALHRAKAGDTVEVATADGRVHRYRVSSVRVYVKRKLPLDIYSRKGPARLVLVTCGGPFDRASGHYRDNVVVTATPA